MVFALAVLALPSSSQLGYPQNDAEYNSSGIRIVAHSPLIVFHKSIQESELDERNVMVSQAYFNPQDRYTIVDGKSQDRYIQEEFLAGCVYGCHYVITNVSSSQLSLDILYQIPVGSIPIQGGVKTKSVHITLSSYSIYTGEFLFYFPSPGDYGHFCIHVSNMGKTIGTARVQLPGGKPILNVVSALTKHDQHSWNTYISQVADDNTVLDYLANQNIWTLDFTHMAWRMRNRDFFTKALNVLRQRLFFSKTLWGYALMHKIESAIVELLLHDPDKLVELVGVNAYIPHLYISTMAWDMRQDEHYEFWPLINARIHQLGSDREILDEKLEATYNNFLAKLLLKKHESKGDLLRATYFLLIQDRIKEAKAMFAHAKAKEGGDLEEEYSKFIKLQSDYLEAYLDFYNDEPKLAPSIVAKYVDYPILRWRRMFLAMKQQLDEYESRIDPNELVDEMSRSQRLEHLASSETTLQIETSPGKIHLEYQNCTFVQVSFYQMDVELLFSKFLPTSLGEFAYVKPNLCIKVPLDQSEGQKVMTKVLDIPSKFEDSNVMIEASAEGVSRVVPYFSHNMIINVSEQSGLIKVYGKEDGRPIAKAYIKVFATHTGASRRFYKDGYTDLRGAFDYVSLSTNDLDTVINFSILIVSTKGTRVLGANPPARAH